MLARLKECSRQKPIFRFVSCSIAYLRRVSFTLSTSCLLSDFHYITRLQEDVFAAKQLLWVNMGFLSIAENQDRRGITQPGITRGDHRPGQGQIFRPRDDGSTHAADDRDAGFARLLDAG